MAMQFHRIPPTFFRAVFLTDLFLTIHKLVASFWCKRVATTETDAITVHPIIMFFLQQDSISLSNHCSKFFTHIVRQSLSNLGAIETFHQRSTLVGVEATCYSSKVASASVDVSAEISLTAYIHARHGIATIIFHII